MVIGLSQQLGNIHLAGFGDLSGIPHRWRILLHSYARGRAASAAGVEGKSATKHDQIAGDAVALERAVFTGSISNGEDETSVDLALAIVQ
jgi:hypothetical protein